ncbi:MAG: hypothetical protein ACI4FO_07835 [Acutalibacteraceae bacterium]
MSLNTYRKTAWGIAGGAIGLAILGIGLDELITRLTRYDKDGFDARGFDREGFDRYGFNSEGYDRQGFNIDGFNKYGFDISGYDCEGYDRDGYSADGYDRTGRDKRGYDRNGFDAEGFDRFGRDAEGYYRNGFARDGFNREGFDHQGYGRDHYNCSGIDRAGCCRQFYSVYIEQLRERLCQAFEQMQHGKYRYALYDARVVLEKALKLIVQHVGGQSELGDKLLANLKICERQQLLDIELIDRLHDARKICNINGHEFGAEEQFTHNKVYFVIIQVRELLNEAETSLVHV